MAAKKKKKDKKNKKVIVVDFDTSRLTNGLDFRKAQFELYDHASIEEIEDAMNYHGILLHADQVISDYKPVVNVDLLEEKYHQQYQNELDCLNKKRLVMDEDCIYYFMTKVIEENFDTSKLSDPEYIIDYLLKYHDANNKVEYLIQILKNILNLVNYSEIRDLEEIFKPTGYKVEEILMDIVMEDLINEEIGLKENKILLDLLERMSKLYHFASAPYIYNDLLEMIARRGIEESEDYYAKAIAMFPKKKINIYNSYLAGLERYYKETQNEKTLTALKEIFKEAMDYHYINNNEKDIYMLIKENFSYLMD